ncbi:MAG: hypothetical protein M3N39_14990 [Pseudomonadota bacterium]|nr:hypothetical protein [Pseudomonadota bacterium]
MSDINYFREQVARAQRLAERETLPNVRARYLQSAEAWMRLVNRAESLEQMQSGVTGMRARSPRLI